MRKENLFLKIFILCWFSPKVTTSYYDFFPNFYCGKEEKKPLKCEIKSVTSAHNLQEIFKDFDKYEFKEESFYGGQIYRHEISYYYDFEFKDSTFEKFPIGSFGHFSHVTSITAQNVRLSTLNRDSFTSFTYLEILDLSHNNIQSLENNILNYMKSLNTFNVSYNHIAILNKDAFDEFGMNLTKVDLSHNYIKIIDPRIFETLGKVNQINVHLGFNDIEEISILSTSNSQFKLLDLRYNKLKKINFKCKKINKLMLCDNHLEEVNTHNCEIDKLDIKNNSLITIEIFGASSLDISDNINMKNISLNFKVLKKLVASNVSSEAVNYELLQNAHQLTELKASNTFLGTPKIETFSEITQLVNLNLRNTELSHIEYGMFGHQVNLRNFDISYNNLGHVDIEILSNMKSLKSLDISGNNLTYFNDINDIKKHLQNFTLIGIENNNWNCSYLTKIVKELNENSVFIKQPLVPIKNSSHVMGIGCKTASNQNIKPIDPNHANDLVSQKLNEIIEKVNDLKDSHLSHNERGINVISLNILITLIATVLLVIGVIFGYLKLKNIYYRRYETPIVLARSTNASNMTVEIPFDDRKF